MKNSKKPFYQDRSVVAPYRLKNLSGKSISLKDLFGKSNEMILIHNMGPQCPYCTLWADGLNAFVPYFRGLLSFVLETDIPNKSLHRFSKKRRWKMPVVSSFGTTLKADLGFKNKKGNIPGFSILKKSSSGQIKRIKFGYFGPGDSYCSIWPLLNLTPEAKKKFRPCFQV